jgi:hypothetical protein
MSEHRLAVSRIVEGTPSTIFKMVCEPAMQVEIDGSGMLQAAPGAKAVTAVGDEFEMEMDREPLGDLPMGKYKALNTVTKIVPDELLEWNVGSRERGAFGHVYGWELAAVDDSHTKATNYCDWTNTPERARDKFPIVPEAMMQRSVDNLAALAADAAKAGE